MSKKFYIEVGSHDGIFQSQTKTLEDSGMWNGMLIEANPYLLEKCIKNRNNQTNIFVNKCLVPKNYKEEFVTFYTYNTEGAMGRMEGYFFNEEAKGEKLKIPAININDLLKSYNVKVVDFFSIDIEGADIDILDSIDFNIIDYKEILLEIHHEHKIDYVKQNYCSLFNINHEKNSINQTHLRLIKK